MAIMIQNVRRTVQTEGSIANHPELLSKRLPPSTSEGLAPLNTAIRSSVVFFARNDSYK